MTSQISLADVQALFWRVITHPTGAVDFLRQCDDATRAQVDACFDESPSFRRADRLEVYAQAYFYRLLDTLAELFPLTQWRLGPVHFHNLVTDFLLAHPSKSPDMTHIAEPFPEFIRRHDSAATNADAADLARIEYAIRSVLDAPDGAPITRDELASIPPRTWPALRFQTAPYVRLVTCHANYDTLRQAKSEGLASEGVATELTATPRLYLVWRQDLKVWTRHLDEGEASLLGRVAAGESFEASSAFAQSAGMPPEEVVRYLLRWTQTGLLEHAAVVGPQRR